MHKKIDFNVQFKYFHAFIHFISSYIQIEINIPGIYPKGILNQREQKLWHEKQIFFVSFWILLVIYEARTSGIANMYNYVSQQRKLASCALLFYLL